ncbi:hypothetical protein CIT31_29100 [Mesorhizobium wenxiniae]|uniref:Uncharacterized protein n=2 Tax=Mesorhizobium wenxiniae TaxID=2014805 RepID=A0A271K8G7_9HYPH|nr:hypothetical protein CIT31_29100 [Mesorhizobium wenxiniae]
MAAVRFDPEELPSREELRQTLAGKESDVAVEFCFRTRDGSNFFFGLRFAGETGDPDILDAVDHALWCGKSESWSCFPDMLDRIERIIPPRYRQKRSALCREIECVEIGITDWWRRGDVVEVWNCQSAALPNREHLERLIAPFSSLHENTIKFVCLESNFVFPLHHWFGIEISALQGDRNVLQMPVAYDRLVENFSSTPG